MRERNISKEGKKGREREKMRDKVMKEKIKRMKMKLWEE